MDNQLALAEHITVIESELTVPRKGSIRVRIDLSNRILSWRESNRWNRNFTRTINRREVEAIQQGFCDCGIENWPHFYPDRDTVEQPDAGQRTWQIAVYADDSDPAEVWIGREDTPPDYAHWVEILSLVCRQPFAVLD